MAAGNVYITVVQHHQSMSEVDVICRRTGDNRQILYTHIGSAINLHHIVGCLTGRGGEHHILTLTHETNRVGLRRAVDIVQHHLFGIGGRGNQECHRSHDTHLVQCVDGSAKRLIVSRSIVSGNRIVSAAESYREDRADGIITADGVTGYIDDRRHRMATRQEHSVEECEVVGMSSHEHSIHIHDRVGSLSIQIIRA